MTKLEIVKRTAQSLVTTTLAGVFPIHLDQPVLAAERLVVGSVADRTRSRAELPGTLVGIFCAAGVIPGVQIGVGDGLLGLSAERELLRTSLPLRQPYQSL